MHHRVVCVTPALIIANNKNLLFGEKKGRAIDAVFKKLPYLKMCLIQI
jgi:hypothetical protein